jgi:hypothetical protein
VLAGRIDERVLEHPADTRCIWTDLWIHAGGQPIANAREILDDA